MYEDPADLLVAFGVPESALVSRAYIDPLEDP
jgi:hypothetical protein